MTDQDLQITFNGQTMGTTYCIHYNLWRNSIFPPSELIKQHIDDLLILLNKQMSVFLSDSEISQFNKLAKDKDFYISPDFATVVEEAIYLHKLTRGGLDNSIGALVNLWGFGPEKATRIPTQDEIAETTKIVGMDKLIFNKAMLSLAKKVDGFQLNLSSIAKGFAVDKIAQYFDDLKINDYLIEIGGEIRAKGVNLAHKRWRVGIEKPKGSGYERIIKLDNQALATSGDYKKFVDGKKQRFTHIINPRTKQAITNSNIASLSVIAETSMRADGLATGLFVLGLQEALKISEHNNLAVFIIARENDTFANYQSSSWTKNVAILSC